MRRIAVFVACIMLIATSVPASAFATDYDENSPSASIHQAYDNVRIQDEVSELSIEMKEARNDGVINKNEVDSILSTNTYSPEALEEYERICEREASEALCDYELILEGENYTRDIIDLESGGQIIIESTVDGDESSSSLSLDEARAGKTKGPLWQAYGTHKYKTTVTIITLGYCTATLKSTYKLSKSGIELTGKSSDLSVKIGYIEALKYNSYYEKKKAGKGSACKLLGKYKYKVIVPVLGFTVGTYFEKIRQTITCVDISTKNSKVKVKLASKSWKDSEW